MIQVAIKRDAGQELEVQKWICEVLGQPGLFDEAPYEDVLKVLQQENSINDCNQKEKITIMNC